MALTPLPRDVPPLEGVRQLLINLHDSLPNVDRPFTLDDALDAIYQLTEHLHYICREVDRLVRPKED